MLEAIANLRAPARRGCQSLLSDRLGALIVGVQGMQTIRLARAQWEFDEGARLGPPGGFGEVFRGSGGADGPVAIKRLHITAGNAAFRELKIGEVLGTRELEYVVPILDCGQDANSDRYFLVMPICERSLRDELATEHHFSNEKLCAIALDILEGLVEVGDIVHRDLKPGNVLLLSGRWRLADFGLAKFVEDSTSLETVRGMLTPAYGAPEQWRGERPSHATDVYALECIVYEMAAGTQIFHDSKDIREAHLHTPAPDLSNWNRSLVAFVSQTLRKSPAARPTLSRCLEVFRNIASGNSSQVHPAFVEAAALVAQSSAAADAASSAYQNRSQKRKNIIAELKAEIEKIQNQLFNKVLSSSEEASVRNNALQFGEGTLSFGTFQQKGWTYGGEPNCRQSGWDVIGYLEIAVERSPKQVVDYRWSATLVFASTPDDQTYRWREVSFFRTDGVPQADEPFCLFPGDDQFDIALSKVSGLFSVAYGPKPIDGEDEEEFSRRWSYILGKAATGILEKPNSLPISDDYFA